MRIYKAVWFAKFARKERISDSDLRAAVVRAEQGLVDADLGGGLIKQRIGRSGAGRSGGYRTLVFFRVGARAVFAYGFAKSVLDNISAGDLRDLKDAARLTLAFADEDMSRLVAQGEFEEITDGHEH